MKPRETDLVKATLAYLTVAYPRGVWYRTNTGAFAGEYKGRKRFVKFGIPGLADITGVLDGRAIYVECKIGKGKQSANQWAFERAVVGAGAQYHVTRELGDFVL
jgi:hypothetical protein